MTTMETDVSVSSFEFHDGTRTYDARYDQDVESPSVAVIVALSEALGVDPIDMEPLYEVVDTDALNEIVRIDGTTGESVHVSFTFEGYEIAVSGGRVTVTPVSV